MRQGIIIMLKEQYEKQVRPKLQQEWKLKSPLAVPGLKKIVVNAGIGPYRHNKKALEAIKRDLSLITGQSPASTSARQAIAGFGIRQGNQVGFKVTLRGSRMWDFLDKLVRVALPRTTDFRGIDPKAVDLQGNLSIGFKEQLAFPEIEEEKTDTIFGLEVTLVTGAQNRDKGLRLLSELGLPFKAVSK